MATDLPAVPDRRKKRLTGLQAPARIEAEAVDRAPVATRTTKDAVVGDKQAVVRASPPRRMLRPASPVPDSRSRRTAMAPAFRRMMPEPLRGLAMASEQYPASTSTGLGRRPVFLADWSSISVKSNAN